ncbi:MAG: TonB family protein [Caulobacterales bacterium]|jgi:TonB family protein
MFVWATRTVWQLALRAAFFIGLFITVIFLQVAVVTGLRGMGWSPGNALGASGVVVLSVVLGVHFGLLFQARLKAKKLDGARLRLGLPEGACCVVWRGGPGDNIPWDVEGQIQADYPAVAEVLKIEGFAVVDFEVGHDGRAKNLHCVDVWPAAVFYDSAADALKRANFRSSDPHGPRFGPSYRVPFVFRIKGASRQRDAGALAKARKRKFMKRQSS